MQLRFAYTYDCFLLRHYIITLLFRAMEVLDLLFNFRFNTRLEQFVYEFKNIHHQAMQATSDMPEIGMQSRKMLGVQSCKSIPKV